MGAPDKNLEIPVLFSSVVRSPRKFSFPSSVDTFLSFRLRFTRGYHHFGHYLLSGQLFHQPKDLNGQTESLMSRLPNLRSRDHSVVIECVENGEMMMIGEGSN